MDKIRIRELKIFAYHGVFEFENQNGQNFYVNAELEVDTETAGMTDNLDESVNYGLVCELIHKVMTKNTYKLIETAAQKIATEILLNYSLVKQVTVEVRKPEAPIEMEFGSVSVEITRGWHDAVIALGSNMGDSVSLINSAVESLKNDRFIKDVKVSELIITKPYGYTEQDDFVNGALICKTIYSSHKLLDVMHELENNADRKRIIHWGPRTLDLDLIFYDSEIIADKVLSVPHPDMHNRTFVLEPIVQIAPYYRHPVLNMNVSQLLEKLKSESHEETVISESDEKNNDSEINEDFSSYRKINIISAVSANGVIGKNGKIPWNIPEDMQYFRDTTKGNVVIMGRKTFESIGIPLSQRFNIVVSKNKLYMDKNMLSATSLEEALEIAGEYASQNNCEIFLCGGSRIYSEGIKYADRLYLTELDFECEGDVFFPSFDKKCYTLIKSDYHADLGLKFNIYERN